MPWMSPHQFYIELFHKRWEHVPGGSPQPAPLRSPSSTLKVGKLVGMYQVLNIISQCLGRTVDACGPPGGSFLTTCRKVTWCFLKARKAHAQQTALVTRGSVKTLSVFANTEPPSLWPESNLRKLDWNGSRSDKLSQWEQTQAGMTLSPQRRWPCRNRKRERKPAAHTVPGARGSFPKAPSLGCLPQPHCCGR